MCFCGLSLSLPSVEGTDPSHPRDPNKQTEKKMTHPKASRWGGDKKKVVGLAEKPRKVSTEKAGRTDERTQRKG